MIQILTADDVLKCRMSIRRIRRRFASRYNKRKTKMPEYPATLGDFTLGQLREIINLIHSQPFKKQHIVSFPSELDTTQRRKRNKPLTQFIVDVETGSTTQED